jgi:mercuric ion binding protein
MNKLFIMLGMLMIVSSAVAKERLVLLDVPTMNCPVCPFTVEKALNGVSGVIAVDVSFEQKLAQVTFDDEVTSTKALVDATTNAGYPSRMRE